MNPSYLNGPLHEYLKRFKTWPEEDNDVRFCYGLLEKFCYIRYLWTNPDGPVFIVKLWFAFMDVIFAKLYSFNQNPIRRNPNHSSVLSKKQNLGWFL